MKRKEEPKGEWKGEGQEEEVKPEENKGEE